MSKRKPATDRPDYQPHAREAVGVDIRDQGRQMAVIVGTLEMYEACERALLERGIGQSAARMVLAAYPTATRAHVNRMLAVVQDKWRREGARTTREARKALVRQRVEQLWRMALEKKRPLVLTVGPDEQEVEYVDDPDLRAADLALSKLIDLDNLRGEMLEDLQKTPEGARQAALDAFHKAYGAPVLEAENDAAEE